MLSLINFFLAVLVLIEERECKLVFPNRSWLVVAIDNLPFVFFRIVVGGQWTVGTSNTSNWSFAQYVATLTFVCGQLVFLFYSDISASDNWL